MVDHIKLGISRCLLGEHVRYDGGHKLDRFLRDTLGQYVDFVGVCPETECGMGVPREALRLVGNPESPRLVTVKTGTDHTDRMVVWAQQRAQQLEKEDLCGFIFKSNSPSSGMERVKVYDQNGMPRKVGTGIFSRVFQRHFPLLPVEDEGRLHDPKLRENFIESVFALKRWREALKGRKRLGLLVQFHTQNKLLIFSHSEKIYREMGRLVAQGKQHSPRDLFSMYETLFLKALKLKTTTKKNCNVLQHMMGFFKKHLSSDEKKELLQIIEDYRAEIVPLIVPITLFNHFARKYQETYLLQQTYLNPHPIELKLRNYA